MSGLQDFEGDLLLRDTPDGGDVIIENGLFVSDKKLSTAVYLSLFGGNKEDTGKIENDDKEWWGNKLTGISKSEKIRSRFQNVITGLPLSVKNIKEAELAAKTDLKWLIDEKIADNITTYGQTTGKNKFKLTVEILKDKLKIFDDEYFLLWGADYGESV